VGAPSQTAARPLNSIIVGLSSSLAVDAEAADDPQQVSRCVRTIGRAGRVSSAKFREEPLALGSAGE
jgi:hypothetical protein